MITAILAYTAAGAFAVGLLMGGWVSYGIFAPRQYADGFAAGQADERSRAEEKLRTLTARLEADGLAVQKKESDRAREVSRIQQAASDAARLEYSEAAGASAVALDRVVARLRVAEAAASSRRSDGRDRVPSLAGAPAGVEGAACEESLSAGRREMAARLLSQADGVAAQYRLCYDAWPKHPKE